MHFANVHFHILIATLHGKTFSHNNTVVNGMRLHLTLPFECIFFASLTALIHSLKHFLLLIYFASISSHAHADLSSLDDNYSDVDIHFFLSLVR